MGNLDPRKAVLDMAPYSPPTGNRHEKLRLDFNENTVGCSPRVIELLKDGSDAELLTVYPEYARVKTALAAIFKVAPENCCSPTAPTKRFRFSSTRMSMTAMKSSRCGHRMRCTASMRRWRARRLSRSDYQPPALAFPLTEILAAITPANARDPDRESEQSNRHRDRHRGHRTNSQSAPHAAVLIDEAYYEFCGVTALPTDPRIPAISSSAGLFQGLRDGCMRIGCLFSQSRQRRVSAQSAVALQRQHARGARGGSCRGSTREYIETTT